MRIRRIGGDWEENDLNRDQRSPKFLGKIRPLRYLARRLGIEDLVTPFHQSYPALRWVSQIFELKPKTKSKP